MATSPPKTETLPTALGYEDRPDPITLPRGGESESKIPVGLEIDRFVVVETIGSGGMGVVVAAHDTMLDRKVALKLVRADRYPEAKATEGRARLLREARAMAKLADHPHIITIHEVGLFKDDIFIAMEYVEGGTLRTWVKERPRTWREIVRAYIAAGDGLAAAHRAGLVHRDFKPDNVLWGTDGRIRVTDFGLVVGESLESSPQITERDLDDRTPSMSTETGVVLGTPSYMAPEQHKHARVDARADQYSFCVSLYEALYGERPFQADSVDALRTRILTGKLPTPPDKGVPRWLRDVVLRGLAVDPDARFRDMDALLAELRRDRQRKWKLGGAALAVVALVGGGLWLRAADRRSPCEGGRARLAGVWDAAARERVHRAFRATGLPYAEEAAARVDTTLDGYTDRWVAFHRQVCEATHVRGEQSPTLLDRKMACLDRRLRAVGTVLGLLEASGVDLEHSVQAVGGLPSLAACVQADGLAAPALPEDPTLRARFEAARSAVDLADALQRMGRYREGLVRATEIEPEVRAVGNLPLLAELLHVRAVVEVGLRDFAAAEKTLREAVQVAASGRDDERAAELWIALLYLLGDELERVDEAMALRPVVEAALARIGDDPMLTAHYLVNLAAVMSSRGDVTEAEPLLARAVRLEETAQASPGDISIALRAHGLALHRLGRYPAALERFERALATCEEGLGPRHPCVAECLEQLGSTLRALGRAKDAIPLLERGVAVRKAALGEDHPLVAASYRALASALDANGDTARAEATFRQGIAIAEAGHDADELVSLLNNLANLYIRAERGAEALPLFERALVEQRRIVADDHPQIGILLLGRAEVLFNLGRYPEAEAGYRAALAQLARRLPPEHPYHAAPLGGLGQVLVFQGKAAEAIPILERALTLTEATPLEGIDLRVIQFLLARALWDAHKDRPRAEVLARNARDAYAAPAEAERRKEIDRWLGGDR